MCTVPFGVDLVDSLEADLVSFEGLVVVSVVDDSDFFVFLSDFLVN